MTAKAPDLALHVHSGEYDRLHQACALAASAASLGQSVTVAFYMYALKAVVDGDLDSLGLQQSEGIAGDLGAGMEKVGAPPAGELLAQARRLANVRVIACSASAQFWSLRPDELEAGLFDQVAGITSILRQTQGTPTQLYI